ncbi:MAG: cation transporter, partial [Firmicutes bacterium]|nr:cation transporter [Bacillota bacterium]
MTELLLRVFVKNYKETDDPKVREACGKFAGIVGIVSNIILCLMKVIVGMFAGSIAIIADGINNLADASSSVITFIGFKLSSLPEDKEHPYGHARYEYLTGLLVSVLIIVVGVQLLRSSFDKVLNPEETVFSLVTVLVLVIAIVMKVWQAVFNIGLGKRINSMTLIATGTDSRNDVISTTVVLIALIITKITGFQLDGIMGCAVALFIIWSGITLVRDTVSPLLGEAPDEELVREIERRTWQFEGVLGIHDLIVHNYGPGKVFASMHVEIDACGDMMEAHDMIDNIERSISEALKIHIVIHMDPVITNDPELNHLKEVVSNVAALIPGVSNIHDFRMVKGPTHTNVIFDAIVCDNCKLDEDEIKNIIETELRKENPDYFVVITFDKASVDIDTF